MRSFAEQVRAYIPSGRTYKVLGTDGFGRSDTRAKLREFFEVNRHFVVIAALKALADEGSLSVGVVTQAIEKYGINPNKPNPVLV
jgi:pyruvate dehydrogenase E1 component